MRRPNEEEVRLLRCQQPHVKHPGRPLRGAGIGASLMDGPIRLDVAKGIYPEKSIRTNLYIEARF